MLHGVRVNGHDLTGLPVDLPLVYLLWYAYLDLGGVPLVLLERAEDLSAAESALVVAFELMPLNVLAEQLQWQHKDQRIKYFSHFQIKEIAWKLFKFLSKKDMNLKNFLMSVHETQYELKDLQS